jgi:hypothetical protein
MTSIPIIFFHYGNSDYLKYSLKQARYFNPHSPVYLLGDDSNNRYNFITHIPADKYKKETESFTAVYRHLSTNSRDYELNCFLRWFYISAFCREHNIGPFIYLDSDVLLFQDITEMAPSFKNAAIANTCDTMGMPAFTYFSDQKAIQDFCDFLIDAYSTPNAAERLDAFYTPFATDPAMMGGVCDMTLFHFYFADHPGKTLKIDLIDDLAVDTSINSSDGYEMENGSKKIYWQNNLPYGKNIATGKLVRFATLHYQGNAKDTMRRHYKAGGYLLQRLWEPVKIKATFKKIKRSIKGLFK